MVSRVRFDWRTVHDAFADIVFRITTGGSRVEERWTPGGLTNAGMDCSEEREARLAAAFFLGFRDAIPREFLERGYRLEILSHWFHEVDSTEMAYRIAGRRAAEEILQDPDVFQA